MRVATYSNNLYQLNETKINDIEDKEIDLQSMNITLFHHLTKLDGTELDLSPGGELS